jgi:hypothetical protein
MSIQEDDRIEAPDNRPETEAWIEGDELTIGEPNTSTAWMTALNDAAIMEVRE